MLFSLLLLREGEHTREARCCLICVCTVAWQQQEQQQHLTWGLAMDEEGPQCWQRWQPHLHTVQAAAGSLGDTARQLATACTLLLASPWNNCQPRVTAHVH